MTLKPWILQGGRKARAYGGGAILCEECPCGCDTCDALALNPPDGYTRGWRFEISGVPCGEPCYNAPQTYTLDYSDYRASHPMWETCAWFEVVDKCQYWYAVTPDCRVVEWARVRDDCDSSSSSGSSSSASASSSSSSILDYDCICQEYREDPAGSIYYAVTSCDVEDPPPLPQMTVGEAYDLYRAQGGPEPPIEHEKLCGAAKYTRMTNDRPFTAAMVYDYYYEDNYDEQTQQCVRTWEARFAPWKLIREKGINIDDTCDAGAFDAPQSNEEDDLI